MSDPSVYAGQTLPASTLQDFGEYGTYTPALTATTTNPTMGTGSVLDGSIHRNGRHITIWFDITFGTSGAAAGSGSYEMSLPAAFPLGADMVANHSLGIVTLGDDSSGSRDIGSVFVSTGPTDRVRFRVDASTVVTNAVPWTWANNDFLRGKLDYLIDP